MGGVVTPHIPMARSMGRVFLKGLTNPYKGVALQRYDNEKPDLLEVEVKKFVQEIMMRKCKANGMHVWCLLMHNCKKEWVGYYWKGIGNDSNRKYVETWSESLLAHLGYFLPMRISSVLTQHE
jgi:hypothetical protein